MQLIYRRLILIDKTLHISPVRPGWDKRGERANLTSLLEESFFFLRGALSAARLCKSAYEDAQPYCDAQLGMSGVLFCGIIDKLLLTVLFRGSDGGISLGCALGSVSVLCLLGKDNYISSMESIEMKSIRQHQLSLFLQVTQTLLHSKCLSTISQFPMSTSMTLTGASPELVLFLGTKQSGKSALCSLKSQTDISKVHSGGLHSSAALDDS